MNANSSAFFWLLKLSLISLLYLQFDHIRLDFVEVIYCQTLVII
jgi:hypothetical protein